MKGQLDDKSMAETTVVDSTVFQSIVSQSSQDGTIFHSFANDNNTNLEIGTKSPLSQQMVLSQGALI